MPERSPLVLPAPASFSIKLGVGDYDHI
jgi:hypothetical protein